MSGEGDFQTCSLSLHLTRWGVKTGPGAPDFFGPARQINGTIAGAGIPWDAQRRIPKCVPFLPFDKVGRQRAVDVPQRLGLRRGQAAHSAGHLELRREIPAQYNPIGATDPGS